MGKRALQTDGRAKAYLAKGATATCPKCCGPGAPSCCFCIDIDETDPFSPCYPPSIYLPIPDPRCNPARKCCKGSRVRVTTTLTLTNDKNTFDLFKQYQTYTETNQWTMTVVSEWHKEKQLDGRCKSIMDSAQVTTARHREFRFGQGELHIEDTAPNLGFSAQELTPDVFLLPEPVRLYYLLEFFTGSLFSSGGQNDFGPFKNECGGPYNFKEYIPPDENDGLESDYEAHYNAAAQPGCGELPIQVTGQKDWIKTRHPAFGSPYIEYEDHQSATLTESLVVTTLEDNCCAPGENPYNPAPPVIPTSRGNPGFVLVPWAFLWWRGTPIFVRWWTGQVKEPGCGCWHPAKSLWERIFGRAV